MQAAPLPPHLRALAPEVAARLTRILADLAALVAAAFLRNPRFAPIILPLWTRITRAARRVAAHLETLAAGRIPRHVTPRPGHGGHGQKSRIPSAEGWLIRAIGYRAAGYRSQLRHLLAEPGVAELLAAAPAVAHILLPIRRALGLVTPWKPPPQPNPPAPSAPREEPPAPPGPRPDPFANLCPRLWNRWPFRHLKRPDLSENPA